MILGSHDEHLGLLVAMEERRLLSGGEYFVVGVELEQYDERDPEKYLRGVLTSSPDPVILRALTGYLRVAPSPSANMKNFSVNVNEYMKKPPFNFPGSTMKKVVSGAGKQPGKVNRLPITRIFILVTDPGRSSIFVRRSSSLCKSFESRFAK